MPSRPKAVRHTIKRGETLSSIATKYNTNVSSILRWNAMKRTAMLTPGKKIGVPLPPGSSWPRAGKKGKAKNGRASYAPRNAAKTWQDFAAKPERPGYVRLKSYSSEWEGQIVDENGDLLPTVQGNVSGVLGSWRNKTVRPIDVRLIRLIAKVSDRFGGRTIKVVSGYRPGGGRSRHHHGAAIDFSIEGVPNWAVRQYLLSLKSVGVGYYPNSYHLQFGRS